MSLFPFNGVFWDFFFIYTISMEVTQEMGEGFGYVLEEAMVCDADFLTSLNVGT